MKLRRIFLLNCTGRKSRLVVSFGFEGARDELVRETDGMIGRSRDRQ